MINALEARAEDEPDALYGLAARAVQISSDGADLSFPDAARYRVPRWQSAHRPRCRLLAENPQGQGPPNRPAIAARRRRRGGGRRRDRGGALRGPAGARRAAVRGVATDFFARLLLEASLR